MNSKISISKELTLAKELAQEIKNFKPGSFFDKDEGTRGFSILEFNALANRFVESVRRIEPARVEKVHSDPLRTASAGDAYNLRQSLLPIIDWIASLGEESHQVIEELRVHANSITDGATRAFVEEAIKCFEYSLFRSAVVMSWLAAVDVLYKHVHTHKLRDFNAEATRRNAAWRPAKSIDDLARMNEYDFLQHIEAISIIGKSVKQELETCLKLRNGCGHPNSLQLGQNAVARHIEILLMNVFKRF
jgi:hypothetical protein